MPNWHNKCNKDRQIFGYFSAKGILLPSSATGGKMKNRQAKVFLLLEDDTISSLSSNPKKIPVKYQGKKVIFATPDLIDINLLRVTLKSALLKTSPICETSFIQN